MNGLYTQCKGFDGDIIRLFFLNDQNTIIRVLHFTKDFSYQKESIILLERPLYESLFTSETGREIIV
jgi:hypothetical protein